MLQKSINTKYILRNRYILSTVLGFPKARIRFWIPGKIRIRFWIPGKIQIRFWIPGKVRIRLSSMLIILRMRRPADFRNLNNPVCFQEPKLFFFRLPLVFPFPLFSPFFRSTPAPIVFRIHFH